MDWVRSNGMALAIGAVVFVAVTLATGGLGAPLAAALFAGGFAGGAAFSVARHLVRHEPVAVGEALLSGLLMGVVASGVLGGGLATGARILAALAAPQVTARVVASHDAGAAIAAGLGSESVERVRARDREDDRRVQKLVDDALGRAKGKTTAERVREAWLDLKDRRQGAPADMDLAAAEHYLFARSMSQNPLTWALGGIAITAYDGAKVGLHAVGADRVLGFPFGGGRPTDPSRTVTRWSFQGGDDGLLDADRPRSTGMVEALDR